MAIGPFLLGRHFFRSEESNVKKQNKTVLRGTIIFFATSWPIGFCGHCLVLRAIVPSILEYSATTRNCGYFGPFCCVGIAHWHRIDGIERAAVVNMKLSIFRVSDQKITFRDQISVNFDFFYRFLSSAPKEENHPVCGALAAPDHKIVR